MSARRPALSLSPLTWLLVLTWLLALGWLPSSTWSAEPARLAYAIYVHGGALSDDQDVADHRAQREDSLREAVLTGRKILESGGSSLDAVEQVIRFLEDDPHFNAGRGAVLNRDGAHELDASIMDGRNRACGAVAGVRSIKNPISLARLVMTRTRHVLLTGEGADRFGREQKVETVKPGYFWTPKAYASWQEARQKAAAAASPRHMGTVGCVALDRQGNLAAGTSTGGLTNKLPGRVGDSPIIAAGTYADNESCAVSCTGVGEHFIRNVVAYDISARMRYQKLGLAEAARQVIHERLPPDTGAIVAVDRQGNLVADYNTLGVARALADASGRLEVVIGP